MTERNATITDASLSTEDHGALCLWLTLDYGDSGTQGFGGYALFSDNNLARKANYAGLFIWRVFEVAGVQKWSALVGKNIRVRGDHTKITEIGHITKDIWFNPKAEMEELEND